MQYKKILLGVTGGIAAYKACELVRLLKKAGHECTVIMTKMATEFVHPNTFQALSGNKVIIDGNEEDNNDGMSHIHLSRQADVFLIAPATANTIAKIAHGFADNLLTTIAAARKCPLVIAPAMNVEMWQNPANLRNIQQLIDDGVIILGPEQGEQACGEFGLGRMLEASELADLITDVWTKPLLKNKKVLITAGATYEAIDPVRGITNISTGKMGMALARACRQAGAIVTLVHSSIQAKIPSAMQQIIAVKSAEEMYQAVHQHIAEQDIFIAVAAVADYRVTNIATHKLKKNNGSAPILQFTENPDILASVASLSNPPFCVGFAAESENLLAYAQQKRQQKNIPLLVANLVSDAMGQNTNQAILIDEQHATNLAKMNKDKLADEIVKKISTLIEKK